MMTSGETQTSSVQRRLKGHLMAVCEWHAVFYVFLFAKFRSMQRNSLRRVIICCVIKSRMRNEW